MKSGQFWLRLPLLFRLLNHVCAGFQLYSNELFKVPQNNYLDAASYYYTEKSENDVINQLGDISSEEDVLTETPSHKNAEGQIGNKWKPNFSLLSSHVVIPDQSELDEVDEEGIKNGHQKINVNKDDEVVTEIVEDGDAKTPVLLPITMSTKKVDYQGTHKNDEERKLENPTTQNTDAKANATDTKSNNEQKIFTNVFNDVLSQARPLKTKFSGLNTSVNNTSQSAKPTPFNAVGQTLSSHNSSSSGTKFAGYHSNMSTIIRENRKEKQELMGVSVVKPAEKFQAGNDVFFSRENDDPSRVNSSSKISLLDRIFTKKVNQTNTTNSNIFTTRPSQDNTLLRGMDEKFHDVKVNSRPKIGPLGETQLEENLIGLSGASNAGSSSKQALGTGFVSPSYKTVLEYTERPDERQKLLTQKLDRKFGTNQVDSSEHKPSFAAKQQMYSAPRVSHGITLDATDRFSSSSGLSDDILESATNLNEMGPKVQNSNFPSRSKVHTVSRLQSSTSASERERPEDLEEEREMKTYGLRDLKESSSLGVRLPNKRSKFRRTDILRNHSLSSSKKNTTFRRPNAAQRLENFLKNIKQMFKTPETPEDIMGWEEWSPCSRTCGEKGFRTRQRKCGRLVQRDFDVACPEPRVETQKCNEVSCSGESRQEKLKELFKMSEQNSARPKQHASVNNDQKMIDQIFAKYLDHPKVFLGPGATEKPQQGGEEELAQDESTSDNTSDYDADDHEYGDDNSSGNAVEPSANLEDVQSIATGRKRYLYTVWGSWSACTQTCGQRAYAFRKRYCINAVSGEIKRHCQRPTILAKKCGVDPCPVNGGLSPWSKWSSCSDVCGIMERHQSCTNPKPAYGGKQCHRLPVQMRMCGSCKGEQVTAVRKLGSYSPRFLCGFDPCKRVGCLVSKDAICVTDFECNPTFFDDKGSVLEGCKDNNNFFLRPLAQKRCSFNPCAFTKCDVRETKCLVDTKCRPFFVNGFGKKVDCKGSNILQISSEVICGFNPCKITTCTIDPDAKCVTDYRCEPLFINSAGKRISGCTEDEAKEAERLSAERTSNNEKEVTNPTARDQTPSDRRFYLDLQNTVEKYHEEPADRKSTEAKTDKTKTKLQAIELLESILKKRLYSKDKSKNSTNPENYLKSDSRKNDKSSPHKTSERFKGITLPTKNHDGLNQNYFNFSGGSLVTTTVHRNDSETTEVVQHASSFGDNGAGSQKNVKNPERNPFWGNVAHVGNRHALNFSENSMHSNTWKDETSYVGNNSNTSLFSSSSRNNEWENIPYRHEGNLKKVDKIIMGSFKKKKKVKSSRTHSPESFSIEGFPGVGEISTLDSGAVSSVANNSRTSSAPLSTSEGQKNKSSSFNTTEHYQVDIPQWTLTDNTKIRNKSELAALRNRSQDSEDKPQTSGLSLGKSSTDNDVKSDDPYVYPWENYLADMANENGAPVSYDDRTEGSASDQSVIPLSYDNLDGNFQDFDFNTDELAEGEQLGNGTFMSNELSKGPETLEASKSAGATLEKTGEEGKEKDAGVNSVSDLNVQIPLYDMNEASLALSKIASEESEGTSSNKELKEVTASAEASKVAQKTGPDTANNSAELRLGKPVPLGGKSKLKGKPNPTYKSSPLGQSQRLEPQAQPRNITAQQHHNSKLVSDMLVKAVENELSKLKSQGLLGYQWTTLGENGYGEQQESEGKSRKKEDRLNHDKNVPSVPVFRDDNEHGRTDEYGESSLKEIDDFLKKENSEIGGMDGKQGSAIDESEETNSDVFDKNEGSVELPNNYKVLLSPVPGKSEQDAEIEGNEGEQVVSEDSGGGDIHHGKVTLREPEIKQVFSPPLADEIKELGLNEYYIKDGFESRDSKHHKVEDGQLPHVLRQVKPRFSRLRKGEGTEDNVEGLLPLRFGRYRKKFHVGTHPVVASGRQAFLRQHNSDGDEIERVPSSLREDDAAERSQVLEKTTGIHEHPNYLKDIDDFKGKNEDSHVRSLTSYLDHVGHYINDIDGSLLASETKTKNKEESNKENGIEKLLAFDGRNDHEISHSAGEDAESLGILDQASQKDNKDVSGASDDGNELDKGLIIFRASEDHQGRSEDKKSRVDKNSRNSKVR